MMMKMIQFTTTTITRIINSLKPIFLKLSVKIVCMFIFNLIICIITFFLTGGFDPVHCDSEDRDLGPTNSQSSNTQPVNFTFEGLTDEQRRAQLYNFVGPGRMVSDPVMAKISAQLLTFEHAPQLRSLDSRLSSLAWDRASPGPGNNYLNSEEYQELILRAKASGNFNSRIFPNGRELLYYSEQGLARPQDLLFEARASWKLVEALANNPPIRR